MEEQVKNKKVLLIIAFRGFKDPEYFITKETLEEAGVKTETTSNKKGLAIGVDGGEANVDLVISEIDINNFDVGIFIGGPGCLKSLDNEKSYTIIKEIILKEKILAAICISPIILAKAGVLKNKKATVWSSVLDREPIKILENHGVKYEPNPVVVDGKIITADGPSSAKIFSKEILRVLTEK